MHAACRAIIFPHLPPSSIIHRHPRIVRTIPAIRDLNERVLEKLTVTCARQRSSGHRFFHSVPPTRGVFCIPLMAGVQVCDCTRTDRLSQQLRPLQDGSRSAVQTHLLRGTGIRQDEGTESVIERIECRSQHTIVSLQSRNVDFLYPAASQPRREERIGTKQRACGLDDTNDRPSFQGMLQCRNGFFSPMQRAVLPLPPCFRGRVLLLRRIRVFRDNERTIAASHDMSDERRHDMPGRRGQESRFHVHNEERPAWDSMGHADGDLRSVPTEPDDQTGQHHRGQKEQKAITAPIP